MGNLVISEYELRQSFPAPRINLKTHEPMSYKTFAAGSKVRGFVFENTDPQVALAPDLQMIITEDRLYAIPMRVISHLKDVSINGKIVPETPAEAAAKKDITLPQEIRDKLNAIKSSDIIGNVIKNSKNASTGLILGAFAGAVVSIITGRTLVGCAVVGAGIGGFLGYKYSTSVIKEGIKNYSEAEVKAEENPAEKIKP